MLAAPGRLRTIAARWLHPYLTLAILTFLAGAIAGAAAMATTSPAALADAAGAFRTPDFFPERLTAWTIFWNNLLALAVVAAGAVTFGLAAAAGLFLNGLLVGVVVYAGAASGDLLAVLALILPHGSIEFSALFLVGSVAYRLTWRLLSYLRGAAVRPITRREAVEAALLCLVAVLAIAVAAWIEAALTADVARALLGEGAIRG